MIKVKEAEELIFSTLYCAKSETIPFRQTVGRVLDEDIVADRDFPPFDRVMMDGIAIAFDAFHNGQRSFEIAGLQAAGGEPIHLADATKCLEIMTGASLPPGTDTVVRYEDTTIENGVATINLQEMRRGSHVHDCGSDRKQGEVIIPSGTALSTAEIGILTTVGKSDVSVKSVPKVLIVSTGNELVEVNQTPLPFQIRKSNVHALNSLCRQYDLDTTLLHLNDDVEEITQKLDALIDRFDVILLSGGVSMGKLDFLPEVLETLGITKKFHRIAQRPGKPFWFGTGRSTTVFAFPGNPVSTYMCAHRYLLPWLRTSLQMPADLRYAKLKEDFHFKPDLTYFLQVRLEHDAQGQVWGIPVPGQGSGDLANLVDADAFMELPQERTNFSAGECFPIHIFRI